MVYKKAEPRERNRCCACGERGRFLSETLPVCLDCLRSGKNAPKPFIEKAHHRSRSPFRLVDEPPRETSGISCQICVNRCQIPEEGWGYCGLRTQKRGNLHGVSSTEGNVSWYYDDLPTNCVADWVCPGGTGAGYPKFANRSAPENGFKNLAVFYHGCSFDCLFCQNWTHRERIWDFEVMKFIADFHLHSKYSRATSKDMEVETLAQWAKKKGITLLGTGDFTHPTYFAELRAKLEPLGNGLFKLKKGNQGIRYILTAEVSNIYTQGGKVRRIHNLIFAPSFEVVEAIQSRLGKLGKLSSDGRPIFSFPAKELVKMILDISPDCLIVPAHAWTPWFSIFGANSGFDSIEECFGEMSPHIHAIETGLSSDPEMNWRLSTLDPLTLISNSDAHSPNRLGREANAFDCALDYREIIEAIRKKDRRKFLFTIEFFPEEGKYHYDGHRQCGVIFSPSQTKVNHYLCPRCQKKLTVGVMHRVGELSDRQEGFVPKHAIPSIHLIPLEEIVAEALGYRIGTKAVETEYERLVERGGSEFQILLEATPEALATYVPEKIVEGIVRMRQGKVSIVPGHDGVYGKITLFPEEKGEGGGTEGQLRLF